MSTNPDIVLRFSDDDIENIASVQDFYTATGLDDFISDGTVSSVDQVWMNFKQCEDILSIAVKNLRKQRRGWSTQAVRTAASLDWMNYSPVQSPFTPRGELWIFRASRKEAAMDALRATKWWKQ